MTGQSNSSSSSARGAGSGCLDEAGLVPSTTITRVCSLRDAALTAMDEAIATLVRGFAAAEKARGLAAEAAGGHRFYLVDRSKSETYGRLFAGLDAAATTALFRQSTDADIWVHLLNATGMSSVMDRTAREQFDADLAGSVPEVNEGNVRATLQALLGDAELIFQRGLARVFSDLDRRFKSHDGFKLGSRIILTYAFDAWGSLNYGSRISETLTDVERVFAVLDGDAGRDFGSLAAAIRDSRQGGGLSPRQSETTTSYFKVRGFKNGNAHLWFQRDDLVTKANKVLAAYYGEVLPDAVDRDEPTVTRCTALSRDLAFYPTPPAVAGALLKDVWISENSRVLEPSAGEGGIVMALLAAGAGWVDAIEVDPGRVRVLRQIRDSRVTVTEGNFLSMPVRTQYTHVVMNPPFYGTHWMQHVMHAFDFLANGGTLVAVLPVTAELGDSPKHEAFRAWADKHKGDQWRGVFSDLPPESFASAGTRINTVKLTLHK